MSNNNNTQRTTIRISDWNYCNHSYDWNVLIYVTKSGLELLDLENSFLSDDGICRLSSVILTNLSNILHEKRIPHRVSRVDGNVGYITLRIRGGQDLVIYLETTLDVKTEIYYRG